MEIGYTVQSRSIVIIAVLFITVFLISGPSSSYSLPARVVTNEVPQHAEKLLESVQGKLAAHKDWVLMLSWNSTGTKIDYLDQHLQTLTLCTVLPWRLQTSLITG